MMFAKYFMVLRVIGYLFLLPTFRMARLHAVMASLAAMACAYMACCVVWLIVITRLCACL